MALAETTKQILRGLEALCPRALILAGGSYWRGDFKADSDLDIYILAGYFRIYKILKNKNRLAEYKKNWPNLKINIMLVPISLAKRGWYYVAGESADGKTFESKHRQRIITGNTLKLSGWYFLKSADALAPIEKNYWMQKGIKQINYLEKVDISETNWQTVWQNIYEKNLPTLKFSGVNWIVYNVWFLRLGWGAWLFKNPDRFILKKIAKIISNGDLDSAQRRYLDIVVLPGLFV